MSYDGSPTVSVSHVSKTFRTEPRAEKRLAQLLGLGRFVNQKPDSSVADFTALQDISFELGKGKSFGIMGQNGSGKSTLLQIICGIMEPTNGEVKVQGKIAALLELGSGFNPEFTGLENVYLNASILGFSQKEVDENLDAILKFADIGEHINFPVRTYSSGMMLRLAFAVQVAIEPDILVIDEALAVGDVRFQLKCFRRLDELKENGTTILFVSHATELVKSFCDEALVLHKGKQVFLGDARKATIKYFETVFPEDHGDHSQQEVNSQSDVPVEQVVDNKLVVKNIGQYATSTFGVGGADLTELEINGIEKPNQLTGGKTIEIKAEFNWSSDTVKEILSEENLDPNISLGIFIADKKGVYLFGANGFDGGLRIDPRHQEKAKCCFKFRMPHLAEADYFLGLSIAIGDLDKHVQLRWYDYFLPLKCSPGDKNVYGLLGVDYSVTTVENL